MSKKYFIQVGKGSGFAAKLAGVVAVTFFVMSGPVINHLWLGGAWWIDLPYMLFALAGGLLMFDVNARHRVEFDDEADAIQWLGRKAHGEID